MVNYRRNKPDNPHAIFSLVLVTEERWPWIEDWSVYPIIMSELARVRKGYGLKFKAWVILPEHLHLLFRTGGSDYSKIISSFKRGVNAELKRMGLITRGEKI